MRFRIGLVGLCTSHPEAWVPIIRELVSEGLFEAEIVAAWDSGETRPPGFAREFCERFAIPHAVDNPEEMIPLVDGVIVHTTNWDRHMEQAAPFVNAGKAVYIDKPIAGNMRDANRYLDWLAQGRKVTGGSVLRYFRPAREFLALPETERGKVRTAYTAVGVDDFNYGIHGYAILASILGPGIVSARYLGESNQKQIMLQWKDGRVGLLTAGKSAWLPFNLTVVTDRNVKQFAENGNAIYSAMLREVMPFFTGKTDTPPVPSAALIEPELAAMAAKVSWNSGGREIFLSDLRNDDPGFDGTQFAREYLRARLAQKK